ncbi:hypothetical protein [Pseudomonas veronii]|uniref:hypothetical protein n=1 Tax=Pseudomonas veronii TaxID=76761 RepID=UPI0023DEFB7C|nr:hypothetical protein [Pseudomonas veronii]MDF3239969.1 hypothetical protein [Pseudomonas veronii]
MNADQVNILSDRVVSEVFSHVFAQGDEASVDGVAVIAWRSLSEEEFSRRIDKAVKLSAEKLEEINYAL